MSAGKAPLRVAVFTGGAVLEPDCVEFITRVDAAPELQLVGVFCESVSTGMPGVLRDLWKRRRWLAPLLFGQRLLRQAVRGVSSPRAAMTRRRILRSLATRIHFVPDLHGEPVLASLRDLQPDIGAVYGGPILHPELFQIPAEGTLGIHHGLLPHYRGKKTTFWAMHNGEDAVGVAIQRIGSGLDRGDVLRQGVLPTGRMPLPVVTRRLERLGLELYIEALLSVHEGSALFTPQPPASGRLYRDPVAGDIARFWLNYLLRFLKFTARPRKFDA